MVLHRPVEPAAQIGHVDFFSREPEDMSAGLRPILSPETKSQIQFARRQTMKRSSLFVLGLLVSSTPCFGQTTPGDSQTLQALLSEVRLLRQDLRTTTVTAQRSQILIYRLQGQEAAVGRASQRLDEARSSRELKMSGST
jgi:hypothetical protein